VYTVAEVQCSVLVVDWQAIAPNGRLAAIIYPGTYEYMLKVAFVGNYSPRQCGIAAFTADLCETMAAYCLDVDCFAIAVTDRPEGYTYPSRVKFEIFEDKPASYGTASEYINQSGAHVVSLQHEYGIYGGTDGEHILSLMQKLQVPVVTTLHTVLEAPNRSQREVLSRIIDHSIHIVVMNPASIATLTKLYNAPQSRMTIIPHGVPVMPKRNSLALKSKLGLAHKKVLLTFGLLSIDKGIEFVIKALPHILTECPDVVYLVSGVTHPKVKLHSGEHYRHSLEELSRGLGVAQHVIFNDNFISTTNIFELLAMADIYVAPYLKREQIVSGTIAYALGAGKPIIATPSLYATEVLSNGRGVLVPFKDSALIAEQVVRILSDQPFRDSLSGQAYSWSRHTLWPAVANKYHQVFSRVRHL
jgi:glycosyltransferase involved in cell wall biosynthesis